MSHKGHYETLKRIGTRKSASFIYICLIAYLAKSTSLRQAK